MGLGATVGADLLAVPFPKMVLSLAQAIAKGQFFRMNLGPPAVKSTVQVCNIDKAKIDEFLNLIDRRLTSGPARRGQ